MNQNIAIESSLAKGNRAARDKNFELAIQFYLMALRHTPGLAETIGANIARVRTQYRAQRREDPRSRVVLCASALARGGLPRVEALVRSYKMFANVELIATYGSLAQQSEPESRSNVGVPCQFFVMTDGQRFFDNAIEIVAAHPSDIVHLSRPLAENVIFGILYKLIWNARVLVDIDEDVLASVDAESEINVIDYLKDHGQFPSMEDLTGRVWARIAVGLAREFDGITVANAVLQTRYGGEPISANEAQLKAMLKNLGPSSDDLNPRLSIVCEAFSRSIDSLPLEIARPKVPLKLVDFKSISTKGEILPVRKHATGVAESKDAVPPAQPKKLPITVLIITWDVGHNPLGRSYMLAEVVQRVARHSLIVGFQFPRYGNSVWEPVRYGQLPVIALPGKNLPEFHESLQSIAQRIQPDVVIACKPRLPSVELGVMIKEQWGCPLIVDIDDHELSFFKNRSELNIDDLAAMPSGCASDEIEPYAEIWTRLTQSLCTSADEIIVSNIALQGEFGGTIVPHVRDEQTFDPSKYNRDEMRYRHGIPCDAKVVLFFGTPRVHKGIETLARAVNQVSDARFKLVIVGTAPDRSVTAKIDLLAPGRVIYLPNQPFHAIPEILSMADVVCLPQDENHAISQFQLPAKAIDAIAMGIPLLVSGTAPLMQLVKDGVAELVDVDSIPSALERLGGDVARVRQWSDKVRSKFLSRYSYSAAAQQMRDLLQRSLKNSRKPISFSSTDVVNRSRSVLGLDDERATSIRGEGKDVVVFWKQNDTGLYGRRHDMVIRYLAARSDIRKVIVFDAPISEFDLVRRQQSGNGATQDRWIYVGTYEKLLGVHDTDKISYNVFVYPPGKYRENDSAKNGVTLIGDYCEYLKAVFKREDVSPKNSIFWVYPKNYLAPQLIRVFEPEKVVVDVVDDHRAWPNVSDEEKNRLTENYREILSLSDIAFANCEPVQRSMSEYFRSIHLVPNGCDIDSPIVEPSDSPAYEKFAEWTGKTIGYVGNLESKIDVDLLEKIATRFEDCKLVLIGSTHANPDVLKLKRHANVIMPGVIPYREIKAWVSRFDVGLVPHLMTDLTKNMNPLKVFVYLALNIPIVSTEVENVDLTSGLVSIAADHSEFLREVGRLVCKPKTERSEVRGYVLANSWKARLSPYVDELIGRRSVA